MPTRIAPVLLILTLLPLLGGCFSFYRGTHVPDPASWQAVEVTELGFSARLPRQPQLERTTELAPDGAPMTMVSGTVTLYEMIFGFRLVEDRAGFDGHPMDEGAFVDLARQGGGDGSKGSDLAVSQRSVSTRDGYRVEDMTLVSPSTGVQVSARSIQGRTRLTTLIVFYSGAEAARYAPLVASYFDSVRLDPNDASSPNGDGHMDPAQWQYIYPRDAEFAAMLPGDPRRSGARVMLGADEREVNVYQVSDQSRSVSVVEVRLGERGTTEYLQTLSDNLESTGLTVREQHDVQRQGYPGREVLFENEHQIVRSRFYLTGGRIYELRVSAPLAERETSAVAAARFFDSFRIL